MNYVKQVVLCGLLFIPVTFLLAHGTGVSFEETKDGYKIDIGHDEFIAENESVRFDFALYPENIENVEGEVFTDVWVTITKDKKIYFAGGIDKPVFGTTGFTYVYPEQGTFLLSARFQKDGETITKTEFPLTVIAPLDAVPPPNPLVVPALYGGIGLLLGALLVLGVYKLTYKK
jgi:hypothetical protein